MDAWPRLCACWTGLCGRKTCPQTTYTTRYPPRGCRRGASAAAASNMYGALTCTAHPTFVRPQIKCMRILQQFPLADDPSLAGAVSAVLQRIIAVCVLCRLHQRPYTHAALPKQLGAESVKNINKNNALQAVRVPSHCATRHAILMHRNRHRCSSRLLGWSSCWSATASW